MSLALAEILMKQSGESSLDRARTIHNHHGLVLRLDEETVRKKEDLQSVASALMAEPMIRGSTGRAGTFELWHRSARGMPGVGKVFDKHPNGGTTQQFNTILSAEDKRFPLLDKHGISLLDCFSRTPGMTSVLNSYGQSDDFVRGKIQLSRDANNTSSCDITIHPSFDGDLDCILNKFKIQHPNVDNFDLVEFGGGGLLHIELDPSAYSASLTPDVCNLNNNDILFWKSDNVLNEFGYIYISLYILGNFAR